MTLHRRRACLPAVPLALALALLLGAAGPVLAELRAEPAQRAILQETVSLDGVIEAVQQSTVSAQTSGTVQRLPYDVDDSVEAGDLIVQLEDSEQQARLNQAQGSLEEAQANYTDAQQQFSRIAEVHEQGFVSRQEFDQARNNLNAAEARLERARAAVEEARKQLGYTRVKAPYSGILTERHVEIGEAVNPGQPLLSGLSLEQLRVVVELPQKYAGNVRAERRAQVTLADGRVLETGAMTFYPYADPQTHTFRLRMDLDEPESSLYPGMLVKVDVPAGSRSALWIPVSSLVQRGELRAVFVLGEDDRPRLRQVRIGVRDMRGLGDRGRLEVLAGLDEGERVVVNPQALVGSERLEPETDPQAASE